MKGVRITQQSINISLEENDAKIFTDPAGVLTIQLFPTNLNTKEILGSIRNAVPAQTNYDSFREFLKNS